MQNVCGILTALTDILHSTWQLKLSNLDNVFKTKFLDRQAYKATRRIETMKMLKVGRNQGEGGGKGRVGVIEIKLWEVDIFRPSHSLF